MGRFLVNWLLGCLDWKVNKGQDKYKRNKVDHFVTRPGQTLK